VFEWALQDAPWENAGRFRSVQAEIVNFADDVTYAVHDIVDFARAGLIPLKQLRRQENFKHLWSLLEEKIDWRQSEIANNDRSNRVQMALANLGIFTAINESSNEPPFGAERRAEDLWRKTAWLDQFASGVITEFLIGTRGRSSFPIVDFLKDYKKARDSDCGLAIKALHAILKYFVFDKPALNEIKAGQERILESLFKYYYDAAERGRADLIPIYFRDLVSSVCAERLAADIVASLTEQQALNLYLRISGSDLGGFPLAAVRH
jgi:dGTPase